MTIDADDMFGADAPRHLRNDFFDVDDNFAVEDRIDAPDRIESERRNDLAPRFGGEVGEHEELAAAMGLMPSSA